MFFKDFKISKNTLELLHYAISNVSSSTGGGSVWMDYLQPIPAKGSGYHRLVVTLYHQNETIKIEKEENSLSLDARQFNSADFLAENQENLTPCGYCFSQVTLNNFLVC